MLPSEELHQPVPLQHYDPENCQTCVVLTQEKPLSRAFIDQNLVTKVERRPCTAKKQEKASSQAICKDIPLHSHIINDNIHITVI